MTSLVTQWLRLCLAMQGFWFNPDLTAKNPKHRSNMATNLSLNGYQKNLLKSYFLISSIGRVIWAELKFVLGGVVRFPMGGGKNVAEHETEGWGLTLTQYFLF